ncbi:hypothetical protein [Pseudoalteromonas piscicida]|uniref:hypothetical protein n=1 Tax=Pseudoalteromonas piscicida TaxID=43662 RepID=UPI0027E4AB34|nr:hypothetical protein [Pseudoalteromonas piscicida]WMO12905.1 hypothetical protein NI376_12535 [Pseudoalteromonas piscicida]
MYVALKWDHIIGAHFVQWIVVKCSGVTDKFGLPQALPLGVILPISPIPNLQSKMLNNLQITKILGKLRILKKYSPNLGEHHGFCHYAWDHTYLGELVKHAVLYWEDGKHFSPEPHRSDIAYFIDPQTSEMDSIFFAQYKLERARLLRQKQDVG